MSLATAQAVAEVLVREKIERKFALIAAREEARVHHLKEQRTWAKIANAALYRQTIYQARRIWIKQVMDLGLITDRDEAIKLARLRYPMVDGHE